jgi:pre-mRNA-processing factor 40
MLAENTEIDARTRWKDAVEILKDDQRYKNIDDNREREDLFHEFIAELEKKEKEDFSKRKEKAVTVIRDELKQLIGTSPSGAPVASKGIVSFFFFF